MKLLQTMKVLGLEHHSKKGGETVGEETSADRLYSRLMAFFKSTNKTSWGKNELMNKLKDLYIEHLENTIRNNSDQ